jgi:hypothetical protein
MPCNASYARFIFGKFFSSTIIWYALLFAQNFYSCKKWVLHSTRIQCWVRSRCWLTPQCYAHGFAFSFSVLICGVESPVWKFFPAAALLFFACVRASSLQTLSFPVRLIFPLACTEKPPIVLGFCAKNARWASGCLCFCHRLFAFQLIVHVCLGASCRSAALVHACLIYSSTSLSLLAWMSCRIDLVRAQRLQCPVACWFLSASSFLKSFNFCVDFGVNHCREKPV